MTRSDRETWFNVTACAEIEEIFTEGNNPLPTGTVLVKLRTPTGDLGLRMSYGTLVKLAEWLAPWADAFSERATRELQERIPELREYDLDKRKGL